VSRSLSTIALVLCLAACGGSSRASESTTSTTETTTLESSGGETSGGEPRATSEPSDTAAAARVGTHATATTSDAPAEGPSTDLADYARRTMVIVRRHWTIPATLGPEQAAGLSSTISITIDETTHRATGYRIVSESGNAIFDESVRRGLQALVDASTLMPEPPVGLDDRASVRLRLTGR
jgi:hypothetical protein